MPTESDPNSIWLYDPKFPLAVVFAVLYSIPMVVQFFQTAIQYRAWWFFVILVGAILEVAGYAARIAAIKQPHTIVSLQVCSNEGFDVDRRFSTASIRAVVVIHSPCTVIHWSRALSSDLTPLLASAVGKITHI
jgi:hypothetical protein